MTENTPTPPHSDPVDTAPTTPLAEAERTPTNEPAARSGKRRWLIGGGAAVAALALVGGGIAVGAAIADDDDDRDDIALSADQRDADDRGGANENRGTDANGSAASSIAGTASADELIEIADAARAVADGDVVAIDAERDDAWEVHLETAAGDETEVRVSADGTATVTSTDTADGDDTAPAVVLDDAAIDALVTAALADTDGTVIELSADDRDDRPYDVTVLTSDRRTVELDLDASFAVVATESDDSSEDD